jgi:preprotein translocase subunit SecB
MMRKSPLQLKLYYVEKISVVTNDDYDHPKDQSAFDFSHSEIKDRVRIGEKAGQEQPTEFLVQLDLSVKSRPDKPAPYEIEMCVVGFFEVDKSIPIEERRKIVSVTGTSMLFGACRDFLLTITSRAPFGPFFLPTVSFLDRKFVPASTSAKGEEATRRPTEGARHVSRKSKRLAKAT